MSKRRFAYAALALFAALAAALVGVKIARTPKPTPPGDADELARRVEAAGLHAHVTGAHVVYVSADGRTLGEMQSLPWDGPERLRGMVQCERAAHGRGVEVAGWVLYGDPELVKRVAALLH